jgi:pimeloyl-ACP methyl ester carboxylesterase
MPYLKTANGEVFFAYHPGPMPASLLLLHGSGATHKVWRQQQNLGYHMVALDLPGHGNSGFKPCASVAEAALVSATVLERLQLSRPVVVMGHSLGAAVALHLALYYPQLLNGLILVGGGARLRVLPAALHSLARGEADPNFLRIAFSPSAPAQLVEAELQNYSSCSLSTLYSDLTCCDQFDLSPQLNQIDLPALIMVGHDDRLTPVKYAQFLQNNLPRAQLAVIEKAGHYVMLEQPQQVNEHVVNFMAGQFPAT